MKDGSMFLSWGLSSSIPPGGDTCAGFQGISNNSFVGRGDSFIQMQATSAGQGRECRAASGPAAGAFHPVRIINDERKEFAEVTIVDEHP